MIETAKPEIAALVSPAPPTSEDSRFSPRLRHGPANRALTGIKRLRTMDGLAPGSQFSWFEGFAPQSSFVIRHSSL
jgi:hypothetical protein